MYITNNPVIAKIAQNAGVDRIWVDMEYIGKEERQGGMDTVKSHHTIDDIKALRPVVTTSELLVRINPIHEKTNEYMGSEEEIQATVNAGADVIMLPMFKTASEVKKFVDYVGGRVKTQLLVETKEAAENIDEILQIDGIDEIHIGLNDLHLSYKKTFMFELLCDNTVKNLCEKIRKKGIKYGFGGIARVGMGMLPSEHVIAEHYHLGSTAAILSRSFCNANLVEDPTQIESIFIQGVEKIRLKEEEVAKYSEQEYLENLETVKEKTAEIVKSIKAKRK
jgi:2-keto-3-deoxy-L-rhamnonate aldolase RhmA